ncbi:8-amino-7-oxononanoate synthase [Rickettsiales bacterium]|nr:8-amino-7-oxononanoate synthase [Rickettsiales bacterium]
MSYIENFAKQKIEELSNNNLLRQINDSYRENGVHIIKDNKKYISFSCNDYLGLTHHPKVIKASEDAIAKYGAGAGASRLVTGNHPLYSQLESKIASLKGTQNAIIFGSGYLANIGTIPALVKKGDLILFDRLSHACIIDGIKLSGAKYIPFSHNDMDKLTELLQKQRSKYENCLIITENVFSMDGDIAPISELKKISKEYDSWLMTDDAHGLGIIKQNQIPDIAMGTLSKAVGGYGGYVCASNNVIKYLQNTARSLIYTTALPPSVIAANIAAIDIISKDNTLAKKALDNAKYFTELLGIETAVSSIVAVILGDEISAIKASETLKDEGFIVSAIRPPTVPKGTSRLRLTFSALHKRQDIVKLAKIIKEIT